MYKEKLARNTQATWGLVEFKEIFFKFKGMVESNIKQGSAFVVNHNWFFWRFCMKKKNAHQLLWVERHLEPVETSPLSKLLWRHLPQSPTDEPLTPENWGSFVFLLFCILCSDVKVEERALQCGNPPRRNHPPASDGRLPLRNLVLHYPESSLLEIDVSARMEGHGGGWNVQPVLRLAQSETGKTGPFPPAEVEPGRGFLAMAPRLWHQHRGPPPAWKRQAHNVRQSHKSESSFIIGLNNTKSLFFTCRDVPTHHLLRRYLPANPRSTIYILVQAF